MNEGDGFWIERKLVAPCGINLAKEKPELAADAARFAKLRACDQLACEVKGQGVVNVLDGKETEVAVGCVLARAAMDFQ